MNSYILTDPTPPENPVKMKYRHIQLMSVTVHGSIHSFSVAITEHLGTEEFIICKLCVNLAVSDQASCFKYYALREAHLNL